MNIGELLGAMVQTGMSRSTGERMKNSLGEVIVTGKQIGRAHV